MMEIKTTKLVTIQKVDNGFILSIQSDRMKPETPDGLTPMEKLQYEAFATHNMSHNVDETLVFNDLAQVLNWVEKVSGW